MATDALEAIRLSTPKLDSIISGIRPSFIYFYQSSKRAAGVSIAVHND
jgi:hypothetical protein